MSETKEYIIPSKEYVDDNIQELKGEGWDGENLKQSASDISSLEERALSLEGRSDVTEGKLGVLDGDRNTVGSVLHTIEKFPHYTFTSEEFISSYQSLYGEDAAGELIHLNKDPSATHTIFKIQSPKKATNESALAFHNVSSDNDEWLHQMSLNNKSGIMKVLSTISHITGVTSGTWEWWSKSVSPLDSSAIVERRVMTLDGSNGYLLLGNRQGQAEAGLEVFHSGDKEEPAVLITSDSPSEGLVVKNYSNYATANSLVHFRLINPEDTGTVLRLGNLGTGDYINADNRFRVDKDGNVLPNNLVTDWKDTPSHINIPSEKLVKDYLDSLDGRTENLEVLADKYSSIVKEDEVVLSESNLLYFAGIDKGDGDNHGVDEGIYTITTERNGKELFFKGTITLENLETGIEERVLKYARIISNGTSFEWNEGLGDWIMSAGGGGGGSGPGVSPIRLYPFPLGTDTKISTAVGSDLVVSIQYQNAITTTGTLNIYRNNVLLDTKAINTGVIDFPAGRYTQTGTNNFVFEVSDAFGNKTSVTFLVSGISVAITSTFNESLIYEPSGDIPFTIQSGGIRFSLITLDSIEYENPAPTISNVFPYTSLSHGVHKLSLQAKAVLPNDVVIYSNKLNYNLIVAEENNNTPIISSKFNTTEAFEGATLNVDYIVYKADEERPEVKFYIDNSLVNTSTVSRNKAIWNVSGLSSGSHTLKIACEGESVEFEIEITELDVDFQDIRDSSLKLYLSASNKSNNSIDREEWTPDFGDPVPVYLTNFNYSTNGWIDGGLVFSGLAESVIAYKPFAQEVSLAGMTLEFYIETRNTYGSPTPFIKCMHNDRGFEILSDRIILRGSDKSSVAFFKEGEFVKLSFVIDKIGNTITTFINGVMSGIDRIAGTTFFVQSSPQNIQVNTEHVGGVLHSLRVYSRALMPTEILQNFLYDLPSIDQKLIEYYASDIYDLSGAVDYTKIGERIPIVRIRAYKADVNGNYLPNTADFRPEVDVFIENPFDHTKDFSVTGATIRTQGTSTLAYPIKNYRLILPKGSDYQIEVTETRPTRVLNLKADYMESSMSTNVGFCRLIEDNLYDNKLPIQMKAPSSEDPYPQLSRTTTFGYPVALFLDDGNTLQFWGIYNLNTDKSDPQTFGHYPESGIPSKKFENVRNVGNSAGAFIRKPGMTDQEWYEEVQEDFEANYPKDLNTRENYQDLMDVIEFVSDYPGLEDPNIEAYKAEFKKRIDLEYAIRFMLTCFVTGAVDSFGKDLMLNTWDQIPAEQLEGYDPENPVVQEPQEFPKWYLTFYDLDTCVGIDNTGRILDSDGVTPKYDYDIELVDEGAFAQAENKLWEVITELFADEIESHYSSLRSHTFKFETLWNYLYGLQISKISKGMYNANAQRKYINAPGAETHLHMLHGDRQTQLSRWLTNRLLFVDSKYNYGVDAKRIAFRISSQDASLISFTLTTDTHLWSRILVGNQAQERSYGYVRTKAGVPFSIGPSYGANVTLPFVEGAIFNAERIIDIGDLGRNPNYEMDQIDISAAVNLLVCDLGRDAPSDVLTTFSIGQNIALTKLDLKNNGSLTGVLDLRSCINLNYLDLRGTNYSSVQLPVGGVLEECYLPSSISSISLINQPYLTEESFTIGDGANIEFIRVEGCPNLDFISLLRKGDAGAALRIMDIDLSVYGDTILEELEAIQDLADGIDINGNIVSGSPVFYGKIQVLDYVGDIDLLEYESKFPNITFSKIEVDSDFVVKDHFNERGKCILDSYTGLDTVVEIPDKKFNIYLSSEKVYVLGNYGWGTIDEIGAGVFKGGVSVHLTDQIEVVRSDAFTNLFDGIITTPLLGKPAGWDIGQAEVLLNSEKPYAEGDYIVSELGGSSIALLRYSGNLTEVNLPNLIDMKNVVHLSGNLFSYAADQVEELHIPSTVTTVGENFTSSLSDSSITWVSLEKKPIGWDPDWNAIGYEVYFGSPSTKQEYVIYKEDGLTEEATLTVYGLLAKDRIYGYDWYEDKATTILVDSYPYYGVKELYLGLIISEATYEYDTES